MTTDTPNPPAGPRIPTVTDLLDVYADNQTLRRRGFERLLQGLNAEQAGER